jgi:hypothetical protein
MVAAWWLYVVLKVRPLESAALLQDRAAGGDLADNALSGGQRGLRDLA